jgi:hypothetical protein
MRRLAWSISRNFSARLQPKVGRLVGPGVVEYSCVDAETVNGNAANAFHDIANTTQDRSGMGCRHAITAGGKLERGL